MPLYADISTCSIYLRVDIPHDCSKVAGRLELIADGCRGNFRTMAQSFQGITELVIFFVTRSMSEFVECIVVVAAGAEAEDAGTCY